MNTEELILLGNQRRDEHRPEEALACYAQAFVQDRTSASAFNNYGNVLRELGDPVGAIPFLQRSIQLVPNAAISNFNLAVALLISGDYSTGWAQYESRWHFEHLNGTLPVFDQPRWQGQELKGKTLLIVQEQGLGDTIQFARFLPHIHNLGAKIILQVNDNLASLFTGSPVVDKIVDVADVPTEFDFWIPIMSIAGVIGVTLDNLPQDLSYITANKEQINSWAKTLGPKNALRVGICWSGRTDSWINQHKSVPFENICDLISKNPNYEWINLQVECSDDESNKLQELGVKTFSGSIRNFANTAGLVHHLDVVISVDTSVAHLAGALGRPTWVMLNNYGVDWRWLLGRDSSPWYPSARLFRQPTIGDWPSVTNKIHKFLDFFKI